MKAYPKIRSVYKRDEGTHKFVIGEYSIPEFGYLANNDWLFTEKIDGTNIRVMFDGEGVRFGGKTDNAEIPDFLLKKLEELFPIGRMKDTFDKPACLYGEGYGARIQKGGGKYIPDNVDFALFDVLIDGWWLEHQNISEIADTLGVGKVPVIDIMPLRHADVLIQEGWRSKYGDFEAEGFVLKPTVTLMRRNGERIITKIKGKDF